MNKLLTYSSIRENGEPTVYMAEDSGHIKEASVSSELLNEISKLSAPAKDVVRVVITALSSYEPFGPNKNGDAFYEDHLLRANTYKDDGDILTIPMHKSFEHFSRPYKYHINKPNSPAYGDVLTSVYNDGMRRVELITEVDASKAPDIVEKIRNYEPVSTSMGFRCMKGGDVCSICGNVAKSRKDYCTHLKHKMLRLMPDGRRVFAINPWGKFFDISFVDDPADDTSRAVWVNKLPIPPSEKTASLNEGFPKSADIAIEVFGEDAVPVKKGAEKRANPIKRVPMDIELRPEEVEKYRKALSRMKGKRLAKKAMDQIASNFPARKIAATFSMSGIDLYPDEFQYMSMQKDFPKVASYLWDKNILLTSEERSHEKISYRDVDVDLCNSLLNAGNLLEKRSYYTPFLIKGAEKRANTFTPRPDAQQIPVEEIQAMQESMSRDEFDRFKERVIMNEGYRAGADLMLHEDEDGTPFIESMPVIGSLLSLMRGKAEMDYSNRNHEFEKVMPLTERRRKELSRKKERMSQDDLMSSPMAYQAFLQKRGQDTGMLSRSIGRSRRMAKIGERLLSRRENFYKHASLNLSVDAMEFYDDETIDDYIVSAYG